MTDDISERDLAPFDDWKQRLFKVHQVDDLTDLLRSIGNQRPQEAGTQTECIFCRLFVQDLSIAIWAKVCPVCNGSGVVPLELYAQMLDAYLEERALAERAKESEEPFGASGTFPTFPQDKPARPAPGFLCPQCPDASGYITETDSEGHRQLKLCPTCHGSGAVGHPTYEWTREHATPCPACTTDLENFGLDYQQRRANCSICRGYGVIPKQRMLAILALEQQRLDAISQTPTHEQAPLRRPSAPLPSRGRLTLHAALRQSLCAVQSQEDRPGRIFVSHTAQADHYTISVAPADAPLGKGRVCILRDLTLKPLEGYLYTHVRHLQPKGWTIYIPESVQEGQIS